MANHLKTEWLKPQEFDYSLYTMYLWDLGRSHLDVLLLLMAIEQGQLVVLSWCKECSVGSKSALLLSDTLEGVTERSVGSAGTLDQSVYL